MMMLSCSELRVTGLNGETEINLGTIIISTHQATHLALALQNNADQSISVSLHLSGPLAEILSVSSAVALKPDGSHGQPMITSPDRCVPVNRNLVHDFVQKDSIVQVPSRSHRILSVSLIDLCVFSPSKDISAARQKVLSTRRLEGSILLRNSDSTTETTTIRVYGAICESWIRPDLELLDFGLCSVGSWVFRDITIRNLSQVPARCCLSNNFRPTLEPGNVTEINFSDPASGYELDPKIIRIEESAVRCIRVTFRAIAPVQRDYWLCLQNLDNAEDFWHLHVVAKLGAERLAQKILVSCGSELDFGNCYVNYQTFRDVVVQNNYEDDITLTIMTDRPDQVSFEILNDWTIEDAPDNVSKNARSHPNTEHDVLHLFSNEPSDSGSVRRYSSLLADSTSDQDTVSSNTNSMKYGSPQPTERDEHADTHKCFKKRSRLSETIVLRSGQRKGVRVWYLPMTSPRRLPNSKEAADFDPGVLRDDTFQLSFALSTGESRTSVVRARICESVLRLERNEVHLGNCNVMTRYRTMLSLINCSDLPAYVSISYVSQCVFADAHDFAILPRQAYDLGIEFIPRQVNSDYHKEVTISNLRNPTASNMVFTLRADCVDDQGISLHALFYKLLAPNPTNEIDFGVTVANHRAIRAIKVRNITDKRLILEFDKCPAVTTYLPSLTTLDAARYGSPHSRKGSISQAKCFCQRRSMSTSLESKSSVFDSSSRVTANALVDMDISCPRLEPGSNERQNLPVWHFESSFASLRQYRNQSDFVFETANAKNFFCPTSNLVQLVQSGTQACWIEFFNSLSEGKVSMLDSMPTFFSNYDSEIRFTEQQFRPEHNLRTAIQAGCLTAATTLVLEPKSESVVVLSLTLKDRDVRGKTKIRPIEKYLSIRMVDFDRSRLVDLPERCSKQMYHMAKLFEKGNACRPREVLLIVQACKSRMSIAPLRQLNFGTITCGEQKDKAFTIVNLSEVPLLYEIRKAGTSVREDIRFNLGKGTQGVVRPYFTKVVPFIFAPSREGRYEEKIVVENRLDSSASGELIVKAQIRPRKECCS